MRQTILGDRKFHVIPHTYSSQNLDWHEKIYNHLKSYWRFINFYGDTFYLLLLHD